MRALQSLTSSVVVTATFASTYPRAASRRTSARRLERRYRIGVGLSPSGSAPRSTDIRPRRSEVRQTFHGDRGTDVYVVAPLVTTGFQGRRFPARARGADSRRPSPSISRARPRAQRPMLSSPGWPNAFLGEPPTKIRQRWSPRAMLEAERHCTGGAQSSAGYASSWQGHRRRNAALVEAGCRRLRRRRDGDPRHGSRGRVRLEGGASSDSHRRNEPPARCRLWVWAAHGACHDGLHPLDAALNLLQGALAWSICAGRVTIATASSSDTRKPVDTCAWTSLQWYSTLSARTQRRPRGVRCSSPARRDRRGVSAPRPATGWESTGAR